MPFLCFSPHPDLRDPRHLPAVVDGREADVQLIDGIQGGGPQEPQGPHLDAHPLLHQREGQQAGGQHAGQHLHSDRPGRKCLLRPQVQFFKFHKTLPSKNPLL
ncbi:Glycine receptor subunit alpha-3, partial [Araneus ventricosus]